MRSGPCQPQRLVGGCREAAGWKSGGQATQLRPRDPSPALEPACLLRGPEPWSRAWESCSQPRPGSALGDTRVRRPRPQGRGSLQASGPGPRSYPRLPEPGPAVSSDFPWRRCSLAQGRLHAAQGAGGSQAQGHTGQAVLTSQPLGSLLGGLEGSRLRSGRDPSAGQGTRAPSMAVGTGSLVAPGPRVPSLPAEASCQSLAPPPLRAWGVNANEGKQECSCDLPRCPNMPPLSQDPSALPQQAAVPRRHSSHRG